MKPSGRVVGPELSEVGAACAALPCFGRERALAFSGGFFVCSFFVCTQSICIQMKPSGRVVGPKLGEVGAACVGVGDVDVTLRSCGVTGAVVVAAWQPCAHTHTRARTHTHAHTHSHTHTCRLSQRA